MQRKFISRRSFLKCAGVGAVTAAAAGLLAGCGGSDSSSSSTASSAAPAEPADPNKPYAGVTLYYAATDTEATGPEMQDIVAMVKEKTGINIEFNIIPKADTGEVDKRLVSLQAGDALDIVYGTVALPVPPKGGAGNPYLGGTTSPLEGFQSYTFLVLHSLA